MKEINKIKQLLDQVLRDHNYQIYVYQINENDIDISVIGENNDYIITVNTVEKYEK